MNILAMILTVLGLVLFETISSVDNAIINAEVLTTMGQKAKRWFLTWGLLIAVFVIRGLLPWILVFSVHSAVSTLLMAGGTFLVFLFFHWLFLEEKKYGLLGERFFQAQGVWFFAVVSVLLSAIVYLSLKVNPMIAFGAVVGSTIFFITHGFRENAEEQERELLKKGGELSDISKVFFLMVIDATFSLDGVLGAFAYTLSVPLILLGNGIGAVIVRQLTISNIDKIKKYVYLKNGAMYSILVLGIIMMLDAFGFDIPSFISPTFTAIIVLYFFFKSTTIKSSK